LTEEISCCCWSGFATGHYGQRSRASRDVVGGSACESAAYVDIRRHARSCTSVEATHGARADQLAEKFRQSTGDTKLSVAKLRRDSPTSRPCGNYRRPSSLRQGERPPAVYPANDAEPPRRLGLLDLGGGSAPASHDAPTQVDSRRSRGAAPFVTTISG